MPDGLEKRKFQRLDIPLDVSVEILAAGRTATGTPPLHFRSRNLSRGGICLETKSIVVGGVNLLSGPPFARNNRLKMSIALGPGDPPLEAIGEALWYDISRDTDECICRVGVIFISIEDDGKERLARFLKSG